ncbi:hypothetical protein VNO80_11079 [Phaseolus coccineus]|uniref:Uncharacterized protein n=1 Tax=Phaseolus coccineus TaxID=3886 RepID=A0AAN9N9F1_PHACN
MNSHFANLPLFRFVALLVTKRVKLSFRQRFSLETKQCQDRASLTTLHRSNPKNECNLKMKLLHFKAL